MTDTKSGKMNAFGVKELAKLSRVSVRTLHYYDQIGLLKPARRTEAGYRHYEEAQLLRLQQILFYRELDFPLKAIKELLDDPDFDQIEALKQHRKALKNRQKRLSTLIQTLTHTLDHLQNGNIMKDPKQLYEGMPKEFGTTYRQEAIDEYGKKAIQRSEKALSQMGKQDFQALKSEMDQVTRELFNMKTQDPLSEAVQEAISRHYAVIRKFWGTADLADSQSEAYSGLGTLYVSDARFTEMDGKAQPEFARFMQQAMAHFAETQL